MKSSDEVLVPSHTAFPTIEAICFAGAVPIFVDVDDSYTVDLEDAAAKVTPRTVGFVPVHLYGQPADLTGIRELCARAASGSSRTAPRRTARPGTAARWGASGAPRVFSFYPSKNLTVMGDGGLLVTDDDDVAARCRRLRDHGRLNKDIHAEVGFNLRFNDIQAAIGRVLLRRLDAMNDRRRELAAPLHARARGAAARPAHRDAGRPPRLSPLRRAHCPSAMPSRSSSRSAASPRAFTTRCRATSSPPSSTSPRRRSSAPSAS